MFTKERGIRADNRTNSTTSLPINLMGKYSSSLDRRRRRLRSKDRDQRTVSHNDLLRDGEVICHERDKQYYCSLQQFHCESNMCINNYHSKTEVYCMKKLLINSTFDTLSSDII